MRIRPYIRGEQDALLTIFHSSVHRLASRDYTAEQIAAWAPSVLDTESQWSWNSRIDANCPWVEDPDFACCPVLEFESRVRTLIATSFEKDATQKYCCSYKFHVSLRLLKSDNNLNSRSRKIYQIYGEAGRQLLA